MRFSLFIPLLILFFFGVFPSSAWSQRDCRVAQDGQINCVVQNIIDSAAPNTFGLFSAPAETLPSKNCVINDPAGPCKFSGTVCKRLVSSQISGLIECVGGNDLSTVYDPAHNNNMLTNYTHNTTAGIKALDADQGLYAVANKDYDNSSYKPIYSIADSKNHMLIESAVMGCGAIEKNDDDLVCHQVETYGNNHPKTFHVSMGDVRAFPQKNFSMNSIADHVSVDLCRATQLQHQTPSFMDKIKTPSSTFTLSKSQSLQIYDIKSPPFSHCNVSINGKSLDCTALFVSEKGLECRYSVQTPVEIPLKSTLSQDDFARLLGKSVFIGKTSLSGTDINQYAGGLLRVDDPKGLIEESGFTGNTMGSSQSRSGGR